MAQTVTMSSIGTSDPILTDFYGAKTTTAQITPTSTSMTFDATLQVTLNSSMRGETVIWSLLSTAHYAAEAVVQILTPVAGLRLSSTAISSSSICLTTLQGVGGA